MVELILFIVIISIALVGILQVMRLTTANSADPVRRKQALLLAEAMLEEVQLAKFTYCDPTSSNADTAANTAACIGIQERFGQANGEPVGARPYDNVNDYVTASGAWQSPFDNGAGALTDADGQVIALTGYTVQLMITPESLNGIGSPGTSADTEVLRISVKVSYDNQTVVLDGYRTRYAPNAL